MVENPLDKQSRDVLLAYGRDGTATRDNGLEALAKSSRDESVGASEKEAYGVTEDVGAKAPANFSDAPSSVQREFWTAIGNWTAEQHAMAQSVYETHGVSAKSQACPIRWDEKWRKRAAWTRRGNERGKSDDSTFEQQREYIRSLSAEEFVIRLTGEEVPRHRKIVCPLPEHGSERTASFHVYRYLVRCYGCGFRGDVYEFAGALWGIDPKSSRFRELHSQLYEAVR